MNPTWGCWQRPRWSSSSPPSSKPRGAKSHLTCESFFLGSPVLQPTEVKRASTPALCPPLSPPPLAGIPGPSACQNPIRSLAPFLGLEMQRNFGGILRLRSISAERKRKGEKEWGKESTILVSTCRILEGTKAPGRRALGPSAGCWRAGRWRNLEVPRDPRGRWAPSRGGVAVLTYVCIAKRLLRVHRGAAAGVGPGEQRPQQQEAERERQAAGRGAHGGRRGGGRGLGLAAAAWARGAPLSPAGAALVWTALRGRTLLSGPHSPHKLSWL